MVEHQGNEKQEDNEEHKEEAIEGSDRLNDKSRQQEGGHGPLNKNSVEQPSRKTSDFEGPLSSKRVMQVI